LPAQFKRGRKLKTTILAFEKKWPNDREKKEKGQVK
jgi:hypothetical protein